MKLLIMISFIAAVGLIAGVTGIPRSHSGSAMGRAGVTSTPTLRDMQSTSIAGKLPAEDFDDRSLVFPREPTGR